MREEKRKLIFFPSVFFIEGIFIENYSLLPVTRHREERETNKNSVVSIFNQYYFELILTVDYLNVNVQQIQ